MKNYMRLIPTLMFAFVTTISTAQNAGDDKPDKSENLTAEERAEKRTTKMKTELNLTDVQSKSVYDINLAHILQMDKYREEQKALREKMKAEKEATRLKIRGVLTPEQAVVFDQKAEEHKQKQEEKHKNCQH